MGITVKWQDGATYSGDTAFDVVEAMRTDPRTQVGGSPETAVDYMRDVQERVDRQHLADADQVSVDCPLAFLESLEALDLIEINHHQED